MDSTNLGAVAVNFIERIERLLEEKKGIADDIKDVKGEAKGQGLDPTMLMYAIKMRAMEREKREALLAEQEAMLVAIGLA